MNPVAYLIYATATLSGFPAQSYNAIEWPSLEICEAKAREFNHALRKPESVKRRETDQVVILIPPKCLTVRPDYWIERPGS